MDLPPHEIERRRKNAQDLVAAGRLGGAEFGRLGGRPRKPRASERVAELVADDADMFYQRLKWIVENGNDGVSISSIRTLLEIEEKERKLEEEEELRFEQLKRDDLIKYLAAAFGELNGQGVFPGAIVDAEFEPVEHRAIEGTGTGDTGASEEKQS